MAQQKLVREILADLALINAKSGPSTRKSLTRVSGQLLVINVKKFKGILKDIFPNINKRQLNNIWADWRTYLSTQADKLPEERKKELRNAMASVPAAQGEVFMITGYDAIRKQKSGEGKLGGYIKKHYVKASKDGLSKIGGSPDTDKEMQGAQLGHEQSGVGVATSAVGVMGAESKLRAAGLDKRNKAVKLIYNYYNEIGVSMSHTSVVTADGGIKKEYVPIVFWQQAISNQEASNLEKSAKEKLEKELSEGLATMTGSTPLIEAVSQVLFNEAAPAKKRRKTKVTGKKKKTVKDTSKATKKTKTTQKRNVVVNNDTGINAASIASLVGKKNNAREEISPFSYVAMINKKLPRVVRKNMRAPSLENRTGAFANSIQVQDATRTRQGFLSFGYTYEKDPYQIFEVGSGAAPWATSQRDPRKLIDKSIREVAAELALGRFYTRRL